MIKSLKTKKKLSAKSQQALAEVQAQVDFETRFVQDKFGHVVVNFSSKDLPLIDYMRSEKVNDPAKNRAKNADNIKRLVRCLEAGEWHFESIDIMIDSDGNLLNGQHTLEALFQHLSSAETPKNKRVKIGFKVGVNRNAMPYLDTQKKRSPQQNLRIKDGDLDISLNRTQEAIVLAEGRNVILGQPFFKSGQINYFEYERIIQKHSSMLNAIFGNRVLSQDFPHKAIGYALFCLAKENEELANEIMDDIANTHINALKAKSAPMSEWKDELQEHELVEIFRREKFKRSHGDYKKFANARDGYRQEDFYPLVVGWIVENHKIDRKVFPV